MNQLPQDAARNDARTVHVAPAASERTPAADQMFDLPNPNTGPPLNPSMRTELMDEAFDNRARNKDESKPSPKAKAKAKAKSKAAAKSKAKATSPKAKAKAVIQGKSKPGPKTSGAL